MGQLGNYIKSIFADLVSTGRSVITIAPYLFNIRSSDLKKEVTEQYPDPVSSRTPDDLPSRTRGILFNDIEKCTGCGDCVKICPQSCISIDTERGAHPTKLWVSKYDIDLSKCIFCGYCVDVCEPLSLHHTKRYEGAVFSVSDMVLSFGRGHVTEEQKIKWARLRKDLEESS